MHQSYHPIGTAGHRSSLLLSYHPYSNYYGKFPQAYGYQPQQHHQTQHPNQNYPQNPHQPQNQTQNPLQTQHLAQQVPPTVPAAPDGGINAVLEYEPQNMSAFVCWCTFGMLSQNRSPTKEFESVLVSILHATRLPKSTMVIALEYLNQRFSNTQSRHLPELEIFLKLVIALILANKFNDDNTFTNRSWCGATGLSIELLNSEEAAWLKAVDWHLNVVNFQSNITTLEECWQTWLDKYSSVQAKPAVSRYSSPAASSEAFYNYSSIPSSPLYDSASSVYSYSSPANSSPIKFGHDMLWSVPQAPPGHYVRSQYVAQPSIWAYPPTAYAYPQANEFYGYANPYYSCNMASC